MHSPTLEPRIDSSLLYTGDDGRQRFVHDIYTDFYYAKRLCRTIKEAQNLTQAIATIYSEILERSKPTEGGIWVRGENVGAGIRSIAYFLDEMLQRSISHPLFEKMAEDLFLKERVRPPVYYSAGESSKVVIHFNPMTQYNVSLTPYLIDMYTHFRDAYGLSLFLTSAAGNELQPELFNFFPEDPALNEKIHQRLLEEGLLTPFEVFLIKSIGKCRGVGVEKAEVYRDLRELELKKLRAEKFDPSALIDLHMERSLIIANNSIARLDAYNQVAAFLTHFYNGTLGRLNPYHFLSKGISYVLLEPLVKPEFDWATYKKKMLRDAGGAQTQ